MFCRKPISHLNSVHSQPEDKQNPGLGSGTMGGEWKDEGTGDSLHTACGAISRAGHKVLDGVGNAAHAVGNKYSEITTKDKYVPLKDDFIEDMNTAAGQEAVEQDAIAMERAAQLVK